MELLVSILCVMLDVLLCIHSYYLLKQEKIKLPLFYILFPIAMPFIGYFLLWVSNPSSDGEASSVSLLAQEVDSWAELDTVEKKPALGNLYQNSKEFIPLEEALLLQDKKVSRWMLMEIVSRKPENFIHLLFLARQDKDIEVVHYATTLIAEVSRSYDIRLQDLNKEYAQDPTNFQVLTEYCAVLSNYLQKGLVTKRMEVLLREDYAHLLEEKVRHKEQLSDYLALIKNELLLKRYEHAKK